MIPEFIRIGLITVSFPDALLGGSMKFKVKIPGRGWIQFFALPVEDSELTEKKEDAMYFVSKEYIAEKLRGTSFANYEMEE